MDFDNLRALDKALLSDALALKLKEKVLLGPHILGIEITQGIQYFRASQHLTDPADRGPDNSLRLVARKSAWVRVYVRAGWGGPVDVTGNLEISASRIRKWVPLWQDVATLSPQTPGTVTAQLLPNYAAERGNITSTLNFIVPAEDMAGLMAFKANIWRSNDSSATVLDSETVQADVMLLQTLRVRGLMVAYNGANAAGNGTLNIAAPTVAELQTTAAWSHTVFPVQAEGGGHIHRQVPVHHAGVQGRDDQCGQDSPLVGGLPGCPGRRAHRQAVRHQRARHRFERKDRRGAARPAT